MAGVRYLAGEDSGLHLGEHASGSWLPVSKGVSSHLLERPIGPEQARVMLPILVSVSPREAMARGGLSTSLTNMRPWCDVLGSDEKLRLARTLPAQHIDVSPEMICLISRPANGDPNVPCTRDGGCPSQSTAFQDTRQG